VINSPKAKIERIAFAPQKLIYVAGERCRRSGSGFTICHVGGTMSPSADATSIEPMIASLSMPLLFSSL
jgi:hypothetical protein